MIAVGKIPMSLAFGLLLILFCSFSYWSHSRLLSWDSPGHLAEAIAFKENVFPGIYGWNSFFLLGFPIDSYPPLSKILASFFSFFLDFSTSIKLLTIISVLAIPVIFYEFLRSFGYSNERSGWASFFVCLLMATFNYSNSATLYSAFFIGSFSNFLSLPFFFAALSFYPKSPKLSALFFSIVILANIISAFNLAVSFFGFFIFALLQNGFSWNEVRRLSETLILGLGLSAFWLFSFLQNLLWHGSSAISPVFYGLGQKFLYSVSYCILGLLSCMIFLILFSKMKKFDTIGAAAVFGIFVMAMFFQQRFFYPTGLSLQDFAFMLAGLSISILLLSGERKFPLLFFCMLAAYFASLLAVIFLSLSSHNIENLFIHIVRFDTVLFFFSAGAAGLALPKLLDQLAILAKERTINQAAAPFFFILISLAIILHPDFRIYSHPEEDSRILSFPIETIGRTAVLCPQEKAYARSPDFQYFFQSRKPILGGLFVEQASLSHISFSHIYSFNDNIQKINWGGIQIMEATPILNNQKLLKDRSNFLWLTDLVVEKDMDKDYFRQEFRLNGIFESGNKTFFHYRVGNFSLVEAVKAIPICNQSKEDAIRTWFYMPNQHVYFFSCHDIPIFDVGQVNLLEYKNGAIRFTVSSESVSPVLIKESFHPNWKAYIGGMEIPIYMASPGFMLVFAKGEVEMKYVASLAQAAGAAVSLASLLFWLFSSSLILPCSPARLC
ncbi:MAG: hypothetical protein N3F07_00020 [Candidatus Micrarchaeota archaeon]|nr:hypothetical protein [Candidatus Micrarchaeota archaeon]